MAKNLLAALEEEILNIDGGEELPEIDPLVELDDQYVSVTSVADEIEAGEESVKALEQLHALISGIGAEDFTTVHAQFTRTGISAAMAGLGMSVATSKRMYKSLESYSGDGKTLALESVGDGIKKVTDGIKAGIKKLIEKIKQFVAWLGSKIGMVKKDDEAVVKELDMVTKDSKEVDAFESAVAVVFPTGNLKDLTEQVFSKVSEINKTDEVKNDSKDLAVVQAKKFMYRLKASGITGDHAEGIISCFPQEISGVEHKAPTGVFSFTETLIDALIEQFDNAREVLLKDNSNYRDALSHILHFLRNFESFTPHSFEKIYLHGGISIEIKAPSIKDGAPIIESREDLESKIKTLIGECDVIVKENDYHPGLNLNAKLPSLSKLKDYYADLNKESAKLIQDVQKMNNQVKQVENKNFDAMMGKLTDIGLANTFAVLDSAFGSMVNRILTINSATARSQFKCGVVYRRLASCYVSALSNKK